MGSHKNGDTPFGSIADEFPELPSRSGIDTACGFKFRGKRRYFKENIEVWKALEDAYKEGKVKAIGVSNFLVDDLENILNNCEIKPMVNQVLCHIGNTPVDVMKFCHDNDIAIEAYSPIAHGAAFKNKKIKEFANKYNVSIPQLCIKYTLQIGTISLPKASSKASSKDLSNLRCFLKVPITPGILVSSTSFVPTQ